MLHITKFYCRSFDLDHLDLFWEIEDFDGSEQDIYAFDFELLRSESSLGPWEVVSPKLKDVYYFRDTSPALIHKWRRLNYMLRITDTKTHEVQEFGPTSQHSEPDLIALEIMRQEDVLFREFIGRKCWLFPVRTFGPKRSCYDSVTARRTRSGHLPCFDTGYLGGYLAPVECFVQVDPSNKAATLTPMLEQHSINTSFRLISFPSVKPKDILVEAENRRWRVVNVSSTQRLRAVVHQEVTGHQIPPGDVEYKLPINIEDLAALTTASERNYTNPQNVNGRIELKDILALYRGPRGTVR